MDDPGNLIYLAFLVISLIAGLVKNRNKNSRPDSHSEQPAGRPAMSVENFREILEQRKAKEQAAEERLKQMEAEAVEAKQRKIRKMPPQKRITEPAKEDIVFHHEENDLTHIDLRKAVIYSEILNPPYV
ncbi:MAG: hypothetical protein R2813_01620 [Flavobacteriales bacterium]